GDRTAHAVHRVADVGRELLGLGPGQRHAEVERMQEAPLADPPAALHQLLVHDRDLAGRAAEADHAELQPEPESLRLGWLDGRGRGVRGARRPFGAWWPGAHSPGPWCRCARRSSSYSPSNIGRVIASNSSSSEATSEMPRITASSPGA